MVGRRAAAAHGRVIRTGLGGRNSGKARRRRPEQGGDQAEQRQHSHDLSAEFRHRLDMGVATTKRK
jgi:hypothetical protein